MSEEENGYELINKMNSSSEDVNSADMMSDHYSASDVPPSPTGDIPAQLSEKQSFLNVRDDRRTPRDWFTGCHPEFIHLVFWKCGKRSGVVFAAVLALLLCFASFSLISIFSYTALLMLGLSAGFTIYRRVHSTISKSGDSHPLRALLELDTTIKPDRLGSAVEPLCDPINRFIIKARAILLIENIIVSAKFAGLMWLLTYIGACFNALTLVIFAWVGVFTVPVLYEKNQTFVDSLVGQLVVKARVALCDIYASVEPKISSALDKLPPSVKNAFNQIQGNNKTQDKLE